MTPEERAEKAVLYYAAGVSHETTPEQMARLLAEANAGRPSQVASVANAIREAIEAEREACAELAEEYEPDDCNCEVCRETNGWHIMFGTPERIADAIRARGSVSQSAKGYP